MSINLTPIGKSVYGTAYSFDGAIPFNVSGLKFGDTIRDNGGKGMSMCVNICCDCGRTYLASTLILCAERGPCCERSGR